MTRFLDRLPAFDALIPVYGVISFPIYAWTVTAWFWKLPSWFLYLYPGEILAIFAYAMTTALVESVFACVLVVLVSILLPPRLFRDEFRVRGFWFVVGLHLLFLGYGGWWLAYVSSGYDLYMIPVTVWLALGLLMTCLLVLLSMHIRIMASIAQWLSDRLSIFLYIQIPVSALSLLVVLFRNIF